MNERLAAALTRARESTEARKARVKRERKTGERAPVAGYVFELDGRRKVGISRHPDKRAEEISLAAGKWVSVEQVVWFPDRAAALQWETLAHRELASAALLGEWFDGEAVRVWLEGQHVGPGRPEGSRLALRWHSHRRERVARTRDWVHNHAVQGAA